MSKIEIEIPDGKKAEWVDGVLTLIDETPKDIKEHIKTFEDAREWCKENGFTELVETFDNANEWVENESKDIFAYLKLRIIVVALNEGWQPQFTDDEIRYFSRFYLYTKEELDAMDEDDRSRVVGRSSNDSNAYGGLVYAYAYHASSNSDTSCGSRLAFKSEELAAYAGKQFIEIWVDYLCA